jgi:glyoxylase-like metal-dependent hydrolase (beta-lactamase superfamily II)
VNRPVFPGDVGNTQGDSSRFTQLLEDVERKVFARLPDPTWFYPGHGKTSRSASSDRTSTSGGRAAGALATTLDGLTRRSPSIREP